MTEQDKLHEIKEHNRQALGKAIQEAGKKLLHALNFDQSEWRFKAEAKTTIIDRNGNNQTVDVLALMTRDDSGVTDRSDTFFGLFVAPSGKLRTEDYLDDMGDFKEKNEIGTVVWTFLELFNKPELHDHGDVQTSSSHEGLGVASALLLQGEVVKDQVGLQLAKHLGKDVLVSTLTDDSDNHWTSRVVSKLPGYTELSLSNNVVKTFQKRTPITN